ncbi:MAG TPA: helix-turn-helix domain-containing protein [Acidobacteriaceae bacterium]|nr:helix-turn-helix domain-containing protein [Acidobacteriaceae bacterium]
MEQNVANTICKERRNPQIYTNKQFCINGYLCTFMAESQSYEAARKVRCGAPLTMNDCMVQGERHRDWSNTVEAKRPETETGLNRRFLTAKEASAFLGGLNSRTLTRWAREGYLPAIPVGEGKRRLWRFLERDLEEWMLSRRTGQGIDPQARAYTTPSHRCSHKETA